MVAKKIICLETGIIYPSAAQAERELKICKVSECCREIRLTAGGFHFAFLDKIGDRTDYENIIASIEAKRPKQNPRSKKVMCVETGIIYNSASEAMRETNIRNIDSAARGDQRTAGGFHWKYI